MIKIYKSKTINLFNLLVFLYMMNKPLIIFLGNSIMRDDRIGLEVGFRLRDELLSRGFDVEILEKGWLTLIDYMVDRDVVIIVDSIITGENPVGSLITLQVNDLKVHKSIFTHGIGLPETIELMKSLNFNYPKRVYIVAIEVKDFFTPSFELTRELRDKLNDISLSVLNKILDILSHE